MCLQSITVTRKKAKEDIICYKWFYVVDGQLISPYHSCRWKVGDEKSCKKSSGLGYPNTVSDGYFHSYSDYVSACKAASSGRFTASAICQCTIPKGSYYYEGIHSDGLFGYASKKLKIVKEL